MLLSVHGESGGSTQKLRGTGTSADAGRASAGEGVQPVGGGTAGGSPSPVGQPVGGAVAERGSSRAEAGGPGGPEATAEWTGFAEDRAWAEARAGSSGVRNRFVDGLAGGALDRAGMRGPLPFLAGLAHPAAAGMELSASERAGTGAG